MRGRMWVVKRVWVCEGVRAWVDGGGIVGVWWWDGMGYDEGDGI